MNEAYFYKHNPIVKRIFLAMLAPTILMNLTTAIGSVADTIIIGHYLDDLSLSVVTFATPIYMIINTFAALFAVGGCIAMSIDSGKGEKGSANRAFSLSLELLTLTGALLLVAGLFFSGIITHWLGAGEDVFDGVREYAKIILVGGPVFVLNIGLAFFVRNDGRPTLSMIGMFSSIVVDIILNFVFVGALGWGVAGAAYSTVIGQGVSIAVIATHFFSSKNTLRFSFNFNSGAWRIIKNGAGTALHFVYQFLIILIMNHFLSKIEGTNGVIIYTVIFNLSTVSLSVFEGISQTVQPMISNYYGEKSYKNIKETLRLALITVFVICGSVTLFLEAVPQLVPVVFGIDDAVLVEKSAAAVRIFATSMIVMTVNVVLGYYLQSVEQTFLATFFVSLRCFVVLLAATVGLGLLFGMNGIWAAYTVAELVSLAIILLVLKSKRKKMQRELPETDLLLLDGAVEKGLSCLTYSCASAEGYDGFVQSADSLLEGALGADDEMRAEALNYLKALKTHLTVKKSSFVELELNSFENKIIIRDNLKHGAFETSAEYGPVLGWNRLCIR